MADIVIAGVILLAAYWGLRRGLIRPLIAEALFILALVVATRYHDTIAKFIPSAVPSFATTFVIVIAITFILRILAGPLIAMIRAIPFVSPVDKSAGLVVHAVLAFVLVYLALGLVLDFDHTAYPVIAHSSATMKQIDDYRQALESNQVLASLIDTQSLRKLEERSGVLAARDAIEQAQPILKIYRENIRQPLLVSHLGPIVNSIGSRLPFIGRQRPYLTGDIAS